MTKRWKLLICDNDVDHVDAIKGELADFGLFREDEVMTASTKNDAIELIKDNFFNLAFVDLMFSPYDRERLGPDVLHELADKSPGCSAVMMTSFAKSQYAEAYRLSSGSEHSQTFLVDKTDKMSATYADIVRRLFASRVNPAWDLEIGDGVFEQLLDNAWGIPELRKDRDAVEDELRSILFDLFDELASVDLHGGRVRVVVELLPTQGLTASVVTRATAYYGDDARGNPIVGNRCIVKIGRRGSILDEVKVFNRLVKMSVPSEFRVELFASASTDALGAVCYSFAGGSRSESIAPFDDLVTDVQTLDQAEDVLHRLFGRRENSWYSIKGPDKGLRAHYEDVFNVRFTRNVQRMWNFLGKANYPWQFDPNTGKLTIPGVSFQVLGEEDLGKGLFTGRFATCLAHGDLHGGNVLTTPPPEMRISLIDYSTAGFAPRFADSAAMEATFRLVPLKDASVTSESLIQAVKTYHVEKQLYRTRSVKSPEQRSEDPWSRLSRFQRATALDTFTEDGDDPTRLEQQYVRTLLVYTVSIIGLKQWNPLQRIRIIAWMSALLVISESD